MPEQIPVYVNGKYSHSFAMPTGQEMAVIKTDAATVQTAANALEPRAAEVLLRSYADERHARYPQYKGAFDGQPVCRVTRRIRTKLGVAFEKGDLALGPRSTYEDDDDPKWASVYSTRSECWTAIPRAAVKEA